MELFPFNKKTYLFNEKKGKGLQIIVTILIKLKQPIFKQSSVI